MVETIKNGISIIANSVVRKYGLQLAASNEDPIETKFFFYTSPNSPSASMIIPESERSTGDEPGALYLYENFNDYKLSRLGGLDEAKVFVIHEKENDIVKKINELSNEYRRIKFPELYARRVLNDDFDFTYEPLLNWANNFAREFSQFLPEVKSEQVASQ